MKKENLVRGINRRDLAAILLNTIIGAGIFGLPSKIFALTGSYSILVYLLCSILIGLIILSFAEVSSRFSSTGGPYLYALETYGSLVGHEIGWLMWLSRITAFAAVCNLLVTYLSYFIPSVVDGLTKSVTISTVVIILTAINFIGVKNSARFSNIFAIGKLIPIILFIAIGLFFIDLKNFNFENPPPAVSLSNAVVILLFAFSGFEVATINAGEVSEPRKNFPPTLIFVLIVVVIIYALIQVVSIGTLPNLAESELPLADAADIFVGKAGASIITAGAIISMIGSLNVTMLGCTRLPFALADEGQWPKFFNRIHSRFKTPHISVFISGIIILTASLNYSFIGAVKINVLIKLITYALVCLSLPILRKKEKHLPALFKLSGGVIISISALLICIWLLFGSSLDELIQVAAVSFIGLIVYLIFRKVSLK